MRLVFLPANQAFVFFFGDNPIRVREEPLFFQSRKAAVSAAARYGLLVAKDGRVRVSKE